MTQALCTDITVLCKIDIILHILEVSENITYKCTGYKINFLKLFLNIPTKFFLNTGEITHTEIYIYTCSYCKIIDHVI